MSRINQRPRMVRILSVPAVAFCGAAVLAWVGLVTFTEPVTHRAQLSSISPIADQAADKEANDKPQATIDFNRDVRPILSDKCFSCHGPDNHDREADLRLDVPEDGDDFAGAYAVIEPGKPDASDLIDRIHSSKPKALMPPADSGLKLSDQEKATLRQWIIEGAKYDQHWALNAPRRPALPTVADQRWPRNDIDRFVLAHLESRGLKPNEEASRTTLIRRLTLDLTGLPPTADEIDAFLNDKAADAYEKVVDRLLASRHFGERMALTWLDAARYADTNGFSIDDHRDMWLWREWVIDAYNRNMPYDQFVVEQIAGDLLPDATDMQRLATGFLRNSMNTHEGGTIPEEYRVIYIADKVDTVSTVFLGLTMRCAQCHDHKYDPISINEYYQFYAFFDTAHEPGMGANNGNTEPVIRMDGPITDSATFKHDLEERIATLNRYILHPPDLVEPRAMWEAEVKDSAQGALADAIKTPAADRTDEQWKTINDAFGKTTNLLERHVSTIKREISVLESDLKAGKSSVMVMKEQGPRQTYVLTRGQYDQPDKNQPVIAGVPAMLPAIKPGDVAASAPTRLDLARWLTREDNPLTARVAVNRTWQQFFGRGLVWTPNDFGSQGAYPSHPQLLDYLALQYVQSGWDTKALVKSIVMSATYRQSSHAPRSVIEADPNNEQLARMARLRLPAELIRDNALAIAGKLDTRVGGPSVYPTQPHGLWREVSHFGYGNAFTAQEFYASEDNALNRRSMYTFWKRTSPPPSLMAFDAPTREVCTVERSRTNTPLQALVLLNDPEYFDTAKELAKLTTTSGGESDEARLDFMFRRATARLPQPAERMILLKRLEQAVRKFTDDPDAARAVVEDGSPSQAAWVVVASVILNLDETITRE